MDWINIYEERARMIVSKAYPRITEKAAAPKVAVVKRLLHRFGIQSNISARCL